jgi:hypothetical protein
MKKKKILFIIYSFFSDIRARLEIAIEHVLQTVRTNSIDDSETSSDNEEVRIILFLIYFLKEFYLGRS